MRRTDIASSGQEKKRKNMIGQALAQLMVISGLLLIQPAVTMALDFVITVKTDNLGTSSSTQFTIPTNSGTYTYDYNVDWTDSGTWDPTYYHGNTTHDYGTPGTYTIRIKGTFPSIYFNNGGDRQKILSVNQWGDGAWASMERAFYGCSNLVINAVDSPVLTNVTSMAYMFRNAAAFNQNISSWVTTNVTDMSYMFDGASAFNQNINSWNTANVLKMNHMFRDASAFNQYLGSWNTGNVTDMRYMFTRAATFNQDISGWDTANVADMKYMFSYAAAFNQSIINWDTASVTDMSSMFRSASAFNQDISSWSTGLVTEMSYMFTDAIAFDQPVGNWNISNVTGMIGMFQGVTLSANNYNGLLINWSAQTPQNNVTFDGGYSQYNSTAAQNARANLISSYNWTITDGGLYGSVTPTPTLTPALTGTPSGAFTPTATTTPVSEGFLDREVQAFPNPAKDRMTFVFHLEQAAKVEISIYNLAGEQVALLSGDFSAGRGQSLVWDCQGIAPGIYLARMSVNGSEKINLKVAIAR